MDSIISTVRTLPYEKDERRIVLRDDTQSGFTRWGRFYIPYDASGRARLDALFDPAFDRLCVLGNGSVLDISTFPILRHIGVYRTSLVIKDRSGQCSVKDIDEMSPSDFIALG